MNIDKKYAKTQRAQLFLKSEEGMSAYNELCRLVEDEEYNTTSTFSPSATDGNLLFIDKHMNYLCSHLGVGTTQYLSNLRLITKVRK
mgnify:CR=1 FL=1